MNSKNVAVDVDDVCALLLKEWLARYNKDYNDNLKEEDITAWEIEKFVKPECGLKIFSYLDDPHLYDNIEPVEGAVKGVKELRKLGFRVVFATSCPISTAGVKYHWLVKNKFEPTEKNYIEIRDKSLLYMDYMIDDRLDNVKEFYGKAFLFTTKANMKDEYTHRVKDWNEVIQKFKEEISLWL